MQVRGGDSGSSDGDDIGGIAYQDDIDNDKVLGKLVAQFAQHGAMAQSQAEHAGDARMPIVLAPDAGQPGPLHVERQQPPKPETLAWYLHHFDDPIYAEAERTTVQVAYKALQFKLAGKVPDKVFDDVCRERWAEAPAGNTYPKFVSLLHHQTYAVGYLWLACGTDAVDVLVTAVSFVCLYAHSTKACSA